MKNPLILLLALLTISSTLHAETITIVADTWCPYNCDAKSPNQGFMVDIVRKAFAKHDIEVEYSTMSWVEAIKQTRKGKFSAIVGASLKDAPDFIFPTAPQGWLQSVFYVKKGNAWRYHDLKSLNDISLGVIDNYSYGDALDDYINKNKLDPKLIQAMGGDNALALNIQKMTRGKVDVLVESKYVMDYYINRNNIKDDILDAGVLPVSEQSKLYIAFSPKDKKLAQKYADIISEEMLAMRANGELVPLFATYGVTDWEK